jgi:hypothetical protein
MLLWRIFLTKSFFVSSTLSSENAFQKEENDQQIIGSLRSLDKSILVKEQLSVESNTMVKEKKQKRKRSYRVPNLLEILTKKLRELEG